MSDSACSTLDMNPAEDASSKETSSPGGTEEAFKRPVNFEADYSLKQVTVTWRNVSVHVPAADAVLGDTLWSEADPRNLIGSLSRPKNTTILSELSGQLRPGEMMMVLGRPGAGCTSLLKVLANDHDGFKKVDGTIHYGSMDHKEARKFRQQFMFNNEEDVHFPTMTVDQTLKFALRNKAPSMLLRGETKKGFVERMRDEILGSLGILHTKHTLVGNEFVRGVSGGERKRVSLAEVMAGQSPIQCWDQSTRGLDASSALDFVRNLRKAANVQRKTIITTLYQAGNAIFDQFDKVIVLASGRVIYYGPREYAQQYFEDMGFVCGRGANIADFLTAVTVPTERMVRPGCEDKVPNTVAEFEAHYKESAMYKAMLDKIVSPSELQQETETFKSHVSKEVSKKGGKIKSVYTVPLWQQIIACTIRQSQIIWGDRISLAVKIVSALVQALVAGSLFYNLSGSSSSIFLRPGALFFPLMYFCMQSLSETTSSFMGRPILSRQKRFAFYRPTAYCIASVIIDIPVVLVQVTIFTIVYYWMVAFQVDAGKFFTFWIVLSVSTLCFLSLYRMIGANCNKFGNASKISGFLTTIMMIYTGYLIPFQKMHVWFRWIFWVNPASYAFESLMGNEFGGLEMNCVEPQYVPYGRGYTEDQYRGCTVVGSAGGDISGSQYIREQYSYSIHHVWRGFGVVVGMWVFCAFLTAVGFERLRSQGSSSYLVYKRGSSPVAKDEEIPKHQPPGNGDTEPDQNMPKQSIFTWDHLDYFVDYHGERLQLLNQVFGYVKPGSLVALMGCSGAGKTTLLDVLAQRKDSGEIVGSILVNGKPQNISFQRTTGYCEQLDVHEPSATVKEALVFSALLRQSAETPRQEKLDYVDKIIDLLELGDISDALIGTPGAGLSIEQRKRVTLGVELVTKPSLLLLDEPTSGLDGQSAYNIVRFMRKLANAGQAVLCTVHQPSASLFNAFDYLLLLAKGGRMTYFGQTGDDSRIILDYFSRNGAPCPEEANPAEHIVDVVQGRLNPEVDWNQIWEQSKECSAALRELDLLKEKAAAEATGDEDLSDFATSKMYQLRLVLERQMVKLWRSPDYVWNKIILHVFSALFSGFTFWKIGNTSFDLQLRLFAIFNFIFVAPGVINQLQPFFLQNRDIFETREKKSKSYHWFAFVSAQAISEMPYLVICGTLYFLCWYFTVGFPATPSISGHMFFQMILYEFLYTPIGQAIAAYAPNEYSASLVNPLVLGAGLIAFCGVVVPYEQINVFWRYWMYYLNPFTYLMGGLLGEVLWDAPVKCGEDEWVQIDLPSNQTCGAYMSDFIDSVGGYVRNASSDFNCQYCQYSVGAEYARQFNLKEKYYSWRDTGITALFCITTYMTVFLMMKLRSKKTKTASS
ncbi:ABC-2 type transporter-domain-containing protein [Aspergillus bertholletiae]|uniref:ABC-2 type transporter-domain-containing protein n=1 Tax=Aspergillus bertholletiae TaxID=1226010 RepID=A0A5N7AWH8_9EURO|nr:ABC-2 type transporter-domain-containing protein [Aspergillus bertholletiae]